MPFVQDLINVVPFGKQDEYQIDDKEDWCPYHCPSKTFGLSFHMHECPGDIIGFNNCKNNEDPVKNFQADEVIVGKEFWLDDS